MLITTVLLIIVIAITVLLVVLGILFVTAAILDGGSASVFPFVAGALAIAGGLFLSFTTLPPILAFRAVQSIGEHLRNSLAIITLLAVIWFCTELLVIRYYRKSQISLYTSIFIQWLITGIFISLAVAQFVSFDYLEGNFVESSIYIITLALLFAGITGTIGYKVEQISSHSLTRYTKFQTITFCYLTIVTFYFAIFYAATFGYLSSEIMYFATQASLLVAAILLALFVIFHATKMSTPILDVYKWRNVTNCSELLAQAIQNTAQRQVHLYISIAEIVGLICVTIILVLISMPGWSIQAFIWLVISFVVALIFGQVPYSLGEMQLRDELISKYEELWKKQQQSQQQIKQRSRRNWKWWYLLFHRDRRDKNVSDDGEVLLQTELEKITNAHPLVPNYDFLLVGPAGWLIATVIEILT